MIQLKLTLFSISVVLLGTTTLLPSTRADINPESSCIPGSFSTIKANLLRTLILCYVYDCPEGVTDAIAKDFNKFHHFDLHPEALSAGAAVPATAGGAASPAAGDATTPAPAGDATTPAADAAPAARRRKRDDAAASEAPATDAATPAPATAPAAPSTDDKAAAVEVPVHVLSKLAKLTSALEKDRSAALTACTDWMSMLNKLLIDIMQANKQCFLEPADRYPAELPDDGEDIDCDEMTVYMRQLQKHFGGQCDSQGKNCPDKLKTAVKWFGKAYKQLGRNCYYDAYEYMDSK